MASWAYMLRCADGSFYVGCTTDLDTRIGQHQGGEIAGYTALRRPVELVWAEEFQDVADAISAERRIKGLVAGQEGGTDRGGLGADHAARLTSQDFTDRVILRAWPETPQASC